jgi:hypothetical protein
MVECSKVLKKKREYHPAAAAEVNLASMTGPVAIFGHTNAYQCDIEDKKTERPLPPGAIPLGAANSPGLGLMEELEVSERKSEDVWRPMKKRNPGSPELTHRELAEAKKQYGKTVANINDPDSMLRPIFQSISLDMAHTLDSHSVL